MELNALMEFDHVIQVHEDGTVTEPTGIYAPEVNVSSDPDGQIHDSDESDMRQNVERQGWTLMRGYTAQYHYSGPLMHPSEYIGGQLEQDIVAEPGYYVAVVAETADHHQGEPAGWVVARRDA